MARAAAIVVAMVALVLAFSAHPAEGADVVGGSQPGCVLRSAAETGNVAGLVVKFGDGRTLTYCIEFSEASITGKELLRRSGLQVVTASSGGLGAAVCSIDGEGCNDPGACFCHCQGGTCEYWAYFNEQGDAWRYSPVGAGARTIRNGDTDAWVWGSGKSSPGTQRPDCVIPSPTPTPQPTSTNVPPTATPTPPREPTPMVTALAAVPTPSPRPPVAAATATAASPALGDPTPTGGAEVRGAVVTPHATGSIVPATASAAGSPTEQASPVSTQTQAAGVIRVDEAQGERNAEAASEAGSWNWWGTLSFAGFAAVIAAGGALVYWRQRAGR